MSKVYVAWREATDEDAPPEPTRLASPSLNALKDRMRESHDSRWQVATYSYKSWTLGTICQAFEGNLPADEVDAYRVTKHGRVEKLSNGG